MRYVELTALLALVLVATALLVAPVFSQVDAAATIASAKQQMVVCYTALLQAESAGANVTSLTSVLNEAGDMLSRSELAYSQGDFVGAENWASQSVQRLGGVVFEANALTIASSQRETYDFWVYFVGSSVGTVVVIIAGFVVWLVVKRRYVPVNVASEEVPVESSGD
jgi:type II secretory pathway pseudopilin PulG